MNTVWLLWYNDDRDYYVKVHDLLGVYTSKEKAVKAAQKDREVRGHGQKRNGRLETILIQGHDAPPVFWGRAEFTGAWMEVEEARLDPEEVYQV